nr:agenet-like domain, agenet domain [Tanacetum cinerariifolium]
MGAKNPIRTLGDYSKPSHEGYRITIELPVGNNVVPLRSDTICMIHHHMGGSYNPILCSVLSTEKDRKIPQRHPDVLTTSWRFSIRSMYMLQGLTPETDLASTQPTKVNKIATSCEICNGPHENLYCMENPEQAFIDYASSRTDEAGADGTKSYPVRIVKDVEVHIGKLKILNDFYVIDMKKDPETPFLVGRGFLATTNAVIDCRMAKIAVGEGITRLVFDVKGEDLGEEEAPYWTTLGKRESYKPRPRSEGVGAQTPYYARKDFLDCYLPREWEISRDVELDPYKDTLVFRRMVEFLGAIPIKLKCNMWESEDLIKKN